MDAQAAPAVVYGALALIPPIVAIGLAIWTRQVIVSLLFGIFMGVTIINGYNPIIGLMQTFSTFIVQKTLADKWNIGILTFCLGIGGMIGVMAKSGGTQAIADALVKKAKGVQSTLIATWLMGIAIFFDDYANSMIIGNAMRPLTDRQKISREKLAYILDSTAAPVSAVAPLSTWVAMELGLIAAGLKTANIDANAMIVFFQTIPYRFYCIFAVMLVGFFALQKKDYGPMYKAEIRARKTGQVYASDSEPIVADDADLRPKEGTIPSVIDAWLPILSFTLITIVGLWYNGGGMEAGKSLRDAYGAGDASVVLTWSAFITSIIGGGLVVARKKLTLKETLEAWINGVKTMIMAVIILALAFTLKNVITEMKLADWLIQEAQGALSGTYLPVITFCVACMISFATGTSWGTDAILMPIVIPIAAGLSAATNDGGVTFIMLATMGAVLDGAVFGDHCSPISDTTILSSTAAGSDHIDHVRTQMPYALTCASAAILVGSVPSGFGLSPFISLGVGLIALWLIVATFGKRVD